MDVRLLLRVLRRFRQIVVGGVLLAFLLAFLTYMRVGFSGGHPTISHRQSTYWEGKTSLLLTQKGFPYGTADQKYAKPQVDGAPPAPLGDTARLSQLATLYAEFVNGDVIKRHVLGSPDSYLARHASLQAAAAPPTGVTTPPPVLSISAIATSPQLANSLASRATRELVAYLRANQEAARIPEDRRVIVDVLDHADKATLVKGRKKTIPIVVFLLVMIMTIGVALILENARPDFALASVEGGVWPLPPAEPAADGGTYARQARAP